MGAIDVNVQDPWRLWKFPANEGTTAAGVYKNCKESVLDPCLILLATDMQRVLGN